MCRRWPVAVFSISFDSTVIGCCLHQKTAPCEKWEKSSTFYELKEFVLAPGPVLQNIFE